MKNLMLFMFVTLLCTFVVLLFSCTPVPPPTYKPPTAEVQTVIKNISPIQAVLLIGLVGSVFACFLGGAKYGIPLLISCLVGYGLTAALLFYARIVAIISLVGGLALCGYFIFVKQRALKEIVTGVQKLKDYKLATPRETSNGLLAQEQSETTKKIVKNIKKKL